MKFSSVPLELRFKGEREYLHGSDIYNSINEVAPHLIGQPDAYLSKIVFRKFARNACEVWRSEPSEGSFIIGGGLITSSAKEGVGIRIWIVETNLPIKDRYGFDENQIVGPAVLTHKRITLGVKTPYTPIEEVIALTKALNYRLISDIDGKWLFAKLDLHRPLTNQRESVYIEQSSALANRLTTNNIYYDDELIGEIRFIVGEP